MLQAVQLPAGITDLNTGLSNVDRDALTIKQKKNKKNFDGYLLIFIYIQNSKFDFFKDFKKSDNIIGTYVCIFITWTDYCYIKLSQFVK